MVKAVVRQNRIGSSVASVLPAVLEGSGGVTIERSGNVTTIGFDMSSTELGAELQQAVDLATNSATSIGSDQGIDSNAWNEATARIGVGINAAGDGTDGSANQFPHLVQAKVETTNSAASYEKAGMLIQVTSSDASDYTPPQKTRDIVGIDTRAFIVGSNAAGRAYGFAASANIDNTSDGFAVGGEISIQNEGTSNTTPLGTESKTGLHLSNAGSVAGTSALVINGPGSQWNQGIVFTDNAVDTNLVELQASEFRIGADGTIVLPPNVSYCSRDIGDTADLPLIRVETGPFNVVGNYTINSIFESFSSLNCDCQVLPLSDNTYSLGDTGVRWTAVWAVNGTIQTSDPALKTDVAPLPDGALSIVSDIQPITYKWKIGGKVRADDWTPKNRKMIERPGKRRHWGFDAESVGSRMAQLGIDFGGYVVGEDGTRALRPDQLIPILWKAVQELTARVAKLEQHK